MNALISDEVTKNTINNLKTLGYAEVSLFGSKARINHFEERGVLQLRSNVFKGEGFVSDSVRACIQKVPSMRFSSIPTHITLNESEHLVELKYLGSDSLENIDAFKYLLEQFCLVAEEWRYFLEDHDKNDYVHVHAR